MRSKMMRYFVQYLVLGIIFLVFVSTFFEWCPYKENKAQVKEGEGFVAISYQGVSRKKDAKNITAAQLEEQLSTLKERGYETISQKQLIDYYQKGEKLPNKALFLLFEDGKKVTVKLATPILKKLNYQATMLTFGEKLEKKDYKFLSCKQISGDSHWELGTGGYRMAYINESTKKNHFLMDFIRDEDDVPLESQKQMRERISREYEMMQEIYNQENGEMPKVYALMHSNTGKFGSHKQVSDSNEQQIYRLFACNFNRVGSAWNDEACSPYNLTRIQPKGQWSMEHLLLELGEKPENPLRAADGYASWSQDGLRLTTSVHGQGRVSMGVPKSNQYTISYEPMEDVRSGVLLRCQYENGQYIRVTTKGKDLRIEQCLAGDRTKRVLCHKKMEHSQGRIGILCKGNRLDVTVGGVKEYEGEILIQEPGDLQFIVQEGRISQQVFSEIYIEGMMDRRKGTWQKVWENIKGKAEGVYQSLLD